MLHDSSISICDTQISGSPFANGCISSQRTPLSRALFPAGVPRCGLPPAVSWVLDICSIEGPGPSGKKGKCRMSMNCNKLGDG